MPARLGAVVAALALAWFAPPAAAGGTFGIRLVPNATDAPDPAAGGYLVASIDPAESLHRQVEVRNDTTTPLEVDLYAGAAFVRGDDFRFGEGRAQNALTDWTTVSPSTVRIEPGRNAVADVRIAVPTGPVGGEHHAVIWAEAAGSETAGLRQVHRVGVRMYVAVDGPLPRVGESGSRTTGDGPSTDRRGTAAGTGKASDSTAGDLVRALAVVAALVVAGGSVAVVRGRRRAGA